MTDLTPDHPAVLAALDAETCRARTRIDAYAEDQITQMLDDLASVLTSALPHLTADDLPARLVRDIQVRAIRAAARAATYEDHVLTWHDDWDWTAIAAWLDGLADNIEREADHA